MLTGHRSWLTAEAPQRCLHWNLFAAFIGKLPIPSEPTGFPSGRTAARKVIAMAWDRRQFQHTFFNQTPTANPAQI
ncbi:MAG TPA: hypothetical protein VMS92_20850, partial [Mycobacterium sp.]|nr:hypothetical protein [Mycobacterium sp.]